MVIKRHIRFSPGFHEWLAAQSGRKDHVGQLARVAHQRRWYKKTWRLHVLLEDAERSRVNPAFVKLAHAEWREVRKRAAL